ncbi:uncharacterized protein LOC113562571 [Ooceraea biroi]|uniref:uncharacterized protein LOC113562571 n=1 Tax=Ooceraea biroi TaxID=2015173 RepID=UPI000F075E59|nr:uncharacterized protein LOC113562571 [Ooceraea biroi]
MSQAEGIIRSQTDLHGRIARAVENFKKLGAAKMTLSMAEARLQALESNWARFESNHERLLALPPEGVNETDYIKQSMSTLTEEAFFQQKCVFVELIRAHKAKEPPASTASVKSESTSAPRTTLPRIQLPSFSGKYEDWPAFRDLFSSIIGKDVSATQVEKLHYLKTCLKGEAELLLRNIATTGENYTRAWDALVAYYENKRLLVRAYLSNFVSLRKMGNESAVELRKIYHGLRATVNSLESIGRPINSSEDLLVYLAVELLDLRSRREWENAISETTEPPSYQELEKFLDRRLHTLESMLPVKSDGHSNKAGNGTSKSTRSHLARKQEDKADAKRSRCSLCQGDHFIMLCAEYKKKTAAERKQHVLANNLCLNCLGRHTVSDCASKKACSACDERHHSSLHDACREVEIAKSSHIAQKPPERPIAVLLATARIRVADRYGVWHSARALIDQGSESSMISERLAQLLKLPRSPAAVTVFGVGGVKVGVAKGRVGLSLAPRSGGPAMSVTALVFSRLSIYAGGVKTGTAAWQHIQDLELADPDFGMADPVDVLLGADVYAMILRPGLRTGGVREPVAQHTTLGWILSGAVGDTATPSHACTYQCRVEDELNQLVRQFWEQEEPPCATTLSREDQECEEHFVRTYSRFANGRYMVRLPLRQPLPDLTGTRGAAERVLRSMEAKFGREAEFRDLYVDFMRQYEALGHMTAVSLTNDPVSSPVAYLPHHGVVKLSSSTTKLRVVFNGSSPLLTGETLNQHLMVGPNLLPVLVNIVMRWRLHQFVLVADIEKMYRQIIVHPEDRGLQTILWRENSSQEVREYRLNTVTYGTTCAPRLAIRTVRQLAVDERTSFPLAAPVLEEDVYVDDVVTGAKSLSAALEMRNQLVQACRAGGFPLRKWSANHADLIKDLPCEDRLQQERLWWQPGESHATLGLKWHPHEDCFSFSEPQMWAGTITKRSTLSLTAKLFDPLGWLAPATVRAKIMIQSAWLLRIDWDAPLPEEDARRWLGFQEDLPRLSNIRVPRWLSVGDVECRLELHGFSDASERAYAAAVYLRVERPDTSVEVRLLTAKTKVAPIKQVTLPRLELCAAALLVRLVSHCRQVHKMEDIPLHLWTDSTVTLGWIRGHPSSWKTYVANRVSEIQTSLPDALWHHIPGRDNPADCASRGISPGDLVDHALWWCGPPWLQGESGSWPVFGEGRHQEELPEQRMRAHIAGVPEAKGEEFELLVRYSDLYHLLRITAWCRCWLRSSWSAEKRGSVKADRETPLVLQPDELEEACRCWIKAVQSAAFQKEIAALMKGQPLPAGSRLQRLSPFLDDHGVLRVGGRLRHANLSSDEKHPRILPSESHFTTLVVEAGHRRTLHGGVQMTLGALRREYWIPRG